MHTSRVRIGVTGHRVLTDVGPVVKSVRAAVQRIQCAWPGCLLTVVSALAAGADQMVVDEVLATSDACLVVVLPFASDEYARDFDDGSREREHFFALLEQASDVYVVPAVGTRGRAYLRAGEHIVDQCDVLLAVWDGQSEHGEGGTAQIVKRARRLAKPLVIVQAGNRRHGTVEPTTLGHEQGRIIVERLPG